MGKKEMTAEELKGQVQKANMIISKLERKLGAAEGKNSLLETENEMYVNYIEQLNEKGKDQEEISNAN